MKHSVNNKIPTLVRISTVPQSFEVLLTGQDEYMFEHEFKVYTISTFGKIWKECSNEQFKKNIVTTGFIQDLHPYLSAS